MNNPVEPESGDSDQASAGGAFLARVLGIERDEVVAVAWSFTYFFCVLASYYMLRSVREAMAIVSGVTNIPWLFTGTFTLMILVTPVFGWVTSRFPRRTFLPWIYYFFVTNIIIFFGIFSYAQSSGIDLVWISRAFFVWLSVFNLFVVSVFWSFMADIFSKQQSRRLFGVISAGGSAGALLGPIVTSLLVTRIGFQNLLPISATLLLLAVFCIYKLRHWVRHRNTHTTGAIEKPVVIGGSAWAGAKLVLTTPYFGAIALALACANFLGGVTYIYMADIVSTTFDGTDRQTQVYAVMDALINALSLVGQLLLVKHSVRRLGIGGTLVLLPLISVIGFTLLAMNPAFIIIAGLHVMRRSLGFGFTKPTTDMLYAVVSKEAKYKAKNFVDTAVYRGWDVASSWIVKFMGGLGLSGIALLCVPVAIVWGTLTIWIGREYRRRDQETNQYA